RTSNGGGGGGAGEQRVRGGEPRRCRGGGSPRGWGARLGFDHAFGTVVDWGEEEVGWFPRLPKGNNKGANKLVRLKEELGLEGPLEDSVGYSDSAADLPMLEICERKVVVNPEGELLARAEAEGWEIVRPERPWKSRWGFGWGCLRMLLGLFPK
ncbi:MAG: haloacid dehalogenase-like hydrolase, partial [Verrucomicrobiota bacterium]